MGWIYIITNMKNGKCYIGQTISKRVEKRWSGHRRSPAGLLKYAFDKHGIENFKFDTICEITESDDWRNQLNDREILEIKTRNTIAPNGYNLEKGGTRNKQDINPLTRLKLSTSHMGRIPTEETKRKISETSKGKKHTAEHNAAISIARMGLKFSEETRNKISISQKKRVDRKYGKEHHSSKSVNQYSRDGVFIKTHDNMVLASKEINRKTAGGISQCCLGKMKTSGGFMWKFT